jgi:hypothetical protein
LVSDFNCRFVVLGAVVVHDRGEKRIILFPLPRGHILGVRTAGLKAIVLMLFILPAQALADENDIFLQGIGPETPSANKKPVFVVPLQPVWNSADAELLIKVGKNLVTLIEEAGPWKVVFFDETKALKKVRDHEARLYKKFMKEVMYTESLLRHRRAGHATSGAERVLRLQAKNAGYLRKPDLLCRSLMIVAAGRLFMGQVPKAKKQLRRLAGSCERGDMERSRLVPSKRFWDILSEAEKAAKREATAELTVTADVPGTQVYLNGRLLGAAPLKINGIPTGTHLVGVFRKGYKPWGKKILLEDGESQSLQATVTRGMGGQAEQLMLSTLRDNRVDANVARVVGRLFKRQGGKAALGLFGGVAKQGNEIWVTLYAVDRKGRAKRLKQMKFDPDFLTAHLALSPVMEQLTVLSKNFEGGLLSQAMLLNGLSAVVMQPRLLKWRTMQPKAEKQEAVAARAPVRRGPSGRQRSAAPSSSGAEPPSVQRATSSQPVTPAREKVKAKPLVQPASPQPLMSPLPPPLPSAALAFEFDDEEESLAAEMEALAVQEASEATGLSIEQLQRLAEADMRARIWSAMEADLLGEAGILGAGGLGSAAAGGMLQLAVLRRQPTPKVGLWGGYGVELSLGTLPPGLQRSAEFAVLGAPFLQSTRDDPKLVERVRTVPSLSYGLRGLGRLGWDLGDGSLRVTFQAGLGWMAHQTILTHEQYKLDDDGAEIPGSPIKIQDSVPFVWQGPELSFATGVAYRLPGSAWRVWLRLQGQHNVLGSVVSFVTAEGEQATLGCALGVAGLF